VRNVRFFSTHSHGGGAYCAVMLHAAAALAAGHASVVLTFRARNRGRRSSFGEGYTEGGRPWEKIAARIPGFYQWQVPFGIVSPPPEMARIAPRPMVGHGTTADPPGGRARAARRHPAHHPHAPTPEP